MIVCVCAHYGNTTSHSWPGVLSYTGNSGVVVGSPAICLTVIRPLKRGLVFSLKINIRDSGQKQSKRRTPLGWHHKQFLFTQHLVLVIAWLTVTNPPNPRFLNSGSGKPWGIVLVFSLRLHQQPFQKQQCHTVPQSSVNMQNGAQRHYASWKTTPLTGNFLLKKLNIYIYPAAKNPGQIGQTGRRSLAAGNFR